MVSSRARVATRKREDGGDMEREVQDTRKETKNGKIDENWFTTSWTTRPVKQAGMPLSVDCRACSPRRLL